MNQAIHQRMLVGNWKMHGRQRDIEQLRTIAAGIGGGDIPVLICPPATLIAPAAAQVQHTAVAIGAQDCHADETGAHTGDLAAEMLAEIGATAVIVGHSERRQTHTETNVMVRAKAEAAWRAGLLAIICIGETDSQYTTGDTLAVIRTQLAESVPDQATPANTVIAYEPVWAIGTGRTPTHVEIGTAHSAIQHQLADRFDQLDASFRILYGGSVNATNAQELFAIESVAGGLVGGASRTAADFLPIYKALCPHA